MQICNFRPERLSGVLFRRPRRCCSSSTAFSDFDGLHSGKFNDQVRLYAFDILALDGDDLRKLPLSTRKRHLARLLKRRPDGIFLAPFEQGEIGPT